MICILQIICYHANSQGITSATVNGLVVDEINQPLESAHVILVHLPTGSTYGAISTESGRFTVPHAKVGGPYKLIVSHIGYEDYLVEDLILRLGEEHTVDVILKTSDLLLSSVEITAHRDKIFSEDRTGAATNIDSKQLETLPTIKRSLQDYIRLNPQVSINGGGISFVGINNRYNNFSIDGTVNNDVFGLSNTGTNGGQTGTEPISLDAIEEIQVEVAPMDVRYGGFTGGSINAITRSGTNELSSSVYYLVNNEKFAGTTSSEGTESGKLPDYFERTMGFRVGLPITRDKLFLFLNYEQTKREAPSIFNVGSGSGVSQDDANRVENKLIELSGSNLGGYQPFLSTKDFYKIFARMDWNVSEKHKLTLRHNYVYADQLSLARNENLLQFNNTARDFPSRTNSTVVEVHSKFGNNANELRLGFTSVRDQQNFTGNPFSYINIIERPNQIVAGSGRLFTANRLDQDIFTLTDHFTIFKNNHILTAGMHHEFFNLKHLNITDNFGTYAYTSISHFEMVGTDNERPPRFYQHRYSKVPGNPRFAADFRALQMAFYLQDEFYINNHFKLIGGIRFDIPWVLDNPGTNPEFNQEFEQFGVATDKLPGAKVMLSPRFGFNLDIPGDHTSQLRGGVGMFVSRLPFVWFSNQFEHTGLELATLSLSRNNMPADFKFTSDPFNQPRAEDLGVNETEEINVTSSDFKYPKVFRINLGYDRTLPFWGLVGSFDFVYSNRLNDIDYKNLNLAPSTQNLIGADDRPYFPDDPVSTEYTRVLMLTNTSKGHALNFTFQLQKQLTNGIQGAIAYSMVNSRDVNSGASSMANANWGFVEQVNGPNDLPVSISRYDSRSRINAYFQFTKSFFKNTSTSFGLFYNGQSGLGVSFIYDDDVNNDGETNDLIYVPKDETEIQFVESMGFTPEEQWIAFEEFILSDDYLSQRRGNYSERNGKRMPFEHHLDLKLMQEFNLKIGNKINRLILTFDIFNITNLLNNEWGKVYLPNNQRVELLEYRGGETQPVFFFNPERIQSEDDLWSLRSALARWRGQFGIRYLIE